MWLGLPLGNLTLKPAQTPDLKDRPNGDQNAGDGEDHQRGVGIAHAASPKVQL
jgi:hypothetical protein